jgi:(E)-4-hydroxy-3-methylbut-2-enyl-diphosphate synthase
VQGARIANVPEDEILDRLLLECRTFQDQVRAGTAKLGDKRVDIVPPDPIGELGSGIEKIAKGHVEQISIGES